MAKHLDVADDMHNWAYLAEVMKFDSQYIRVCLFLQFHVFSLGILLMKC